MRVLRLGEIEYSKAWQLQKATLQKRLQNRCRDTLVVCSHPAVVTLGKKGCLADLGRWRGPYYVVERGGRATYHGPGQIVVYPIVHLKHRGQNIAGLLDAIEGSVVEALAHYRIQASGNPSRIPDLTGVWVGAKKVASIGVAVKKWVTYHGLALNFDRAPDAFGGIRPCGLSGDRMTSVEELMDRKVVRREFENVLVKCLLEKIRGLVPGGADGDNK